MSHNYQPSAVEMTVAELPHRGESDYIGAAKLVSARLQLSNFTVLQAMTEQAGISRSHMLNHLLSAGIDAVMSELPEAARQEVLERRNKVLNGLLTAGNLNDDEGAE